MNSRIAIGTAQFGLPYGLTNQTGKVALSEVAAILHEARTAGMDTLDTAIAYGDCEARLGEIGVENWRVISKLPEIPEGELDIKGWVKASIEASLERLGVISLYGLLLHRPNQLVGSAGKVIYDALLAAKSQGLVNNIGVSIYDPAELDSLDSRIKLDIVQAPFNIVDRRLEISGWLERLSDMRCEIHVRSIFLQGLLLMNSGQRPKEFSMWDVLWERWHRWLRAEQLTPLQACLRFALSNPSIDRVILGIDNLRQLHEIMNAADSRVLLPPQDLVSSDLELIDPTRWKQR